MAAKHTVKLTAAFEQNLAEIEPFLQAINAPQSYDKLLDDLTETVVPNLIQFPNIGRTFLRRPTGSIETTNALARLKKQCQALDSNADLRDYVMTDYILLYMQIKRTIYLLSIRHQRQLSFDFSTLWPTTE